MKSYEKLKFLIIAAHPDDCDLMFGGSAVKLTMAGHKIKFISVTNGDAGHHLMEPAKLVKRRRLESQKAGKIAGLVEYQILQHSDGALEATLKNRHEIIRLIRQFRPDVIISHRICDYHADHRAVAQLVMDSAFLVCVPLCCPDTEVLDYMPIFAASYDSFKSPKPFRIDGIVEIDSVLEKKLAMLDCHASQFFEWLPFVEHRSIRLLNMEDYASRRKYLLDGWLVDNAEQAKKGKARLLKLYDRSIKYAEAFELSEYGRSISRQEFQSLFVIC